MAFFEALPDFAIAPDIRAKLLTISPAAIDRALRLERGPGNALPRGASGTRTSCGNGPYG
ncbi:MAG: hypothetical protein LBU16_05355 [Treponema sp.]|nr:hypothetical protein [Treponema sp.]